MTVAFEDLKVLQTAEKIADEIWEHILQWEPFVRDTLGKQLSRAIDSIGANIAEGFGRFHYNEKLQFLYYARGSLFETKYWLNRAMMRHLLPQNTIEQYAKQLAGLAFQLNTLAKATKQHRNASSKSALGIREEPPVYNIPHTQPPESFMLNESQELFATEELLFLETAVIN